MKCFAKVMVGNSFERVEITQDLGLCIVHNGQEYRVNIDNQGRLYIAGDTQLIVKPRASNTFFIEQEKE